MEEATVTLGRISGVFGVRGWVKVFSFTQPRENIASYRDWWLCQAGSRRAAKVLEGRLQGKAVVVRLEGIEDRDAAQALLDWEICVPRSALPQVAPGEYYWADLEGLEVLLRDGRSLGRVSGMLETPAHDVMVIQGERERLVPFVQGVYVHGVDIAAGTITVDWDPEF